MLGKTGTKQAAARTEQHRDGAGGIDALRPGSLAYLDDLVERVAAEKMSAQGMHTKQKRGRRKSVAGSGAAAAAAVKAAQGSAAHADDGAAVPPPGVTPIP